MVSLSMSKAAPVKQSHPARKKPCKIQQDNIVRRPAQMFSWNACEKCCELFNGVKWRGFITRL